MVKLLQCDTLYSNQTVLFLLVYMNFATVNSLGHVDMVSFSQRKLYLLTHPTEAGVRNGKRKRLEKGLAEKYRP